MIFYRWSSNRPIFPLEPQITQNVSIEPQIPQTDHTPKKWPILTPQNVKISAKNPYGHGHFAKKQIQIGHFWPVRPYLQSTLPYMGLPPCAIFHIPDDREI